MRIVVHISHGNLQITNYRGKYCGILPWEFYREEPCFFCSFQSRCLENLNASFFYVLTRVIAARSVKQPSYLGQGHVGDQMKLSLAELLSLAQLL